MSKMSVSEKCGFETFSLAEALKGSARTSGHVVARRGELVVTVHQARLGTTGRRYTLTYFEAHTGGGGVPVVYVALPDTVRCNFKKVLSFLNAR